MFVNYSFSQKILHEICLSSNTIRKIFFEFEKRKFLKTSIIDDEKHIFICGLARSGTTALLESFYSTNHFGSLTYADMPFILAPNIWNRIKKVRINSKLVERAHEDGILIGVQSPEAFEEIFWQTFNDTNVNKFFKQYVKLILNKNRKERYLSKNNQNVNRISQIVKIFPKSQILLTFRSPLDHAHSLLRQHKKFCRLQSERKFIRRYFELTFHSEFGLTYKINDKNKLDFPNPFEINHWLEQWYKTYYKLYNNYKNYNKIIFLCFEKLCNDKEYWFKIQKLTEVNSSYEFVLPKKVNLNFKLINKKMLKKCEKLYNRIIRHNYK